jgi:hypothetical protein
MLVEMFSVHNHANFLKLDRNSYTLLRVPWIDPVRSRITLTISLSYAIIS